MKAKAFADRALSWLDPEGNYPSNGNHSGGYCVVTQEILMRKVKAAQYVAAHPVKFCPAKFGKKAKHTSCPFSRNLVGKILS